MRKGFTLIELLAVIVILAIIALIAIFAITRLMNNARFNTLTNTALAARTAANLYFTDNPDATSINFTEYRDLLTFERDPWGEGIEEIRATINNNREIKIVIELQSSQRWQRFNEISDKWMLKHDGERVVPLSILSDVGSFQIKLCEIHFNGGPVFLEYQQNRNDAWQLLGSLQPHDLSGDTGCGSGLSLGPIFNLPSDNMSIFSLRLRSEYCTGLDNIGVNLFHSRNGVDLFHAEFAPMNISNHACDNGDNIIFFTIH